MERCYTAAAENANYYFGMSSSSIFCDGILLGSQQSILYEFVNDRAELGHISNYLLHINVLLVNLLHEKAKKN